MKSVETDGSFLVSKKLRTIILTAILTVAAMLSSGVFSARAGAATITVDSLDSGYNSTGCTFVEAVDSSNYDDGGGTGCAHGSGQDTIEFSIPGQISPDRVLEFTDSVIINGNAGGTSISGANIPQNFSNIMYFKFPTGGVDVDIEINNLEVFDSIYSAIRFYIVQDSSGNDDINVSINGAYIHGNNHAAIDYKISPGDPAGQGQENLTIKNSKISNNSAVNPTDFSSALIVEQCWDYPPATPASESQTPLTALEDSLFEDNFGQYGSIAFSCGRMISESNSIIGGYGSFLASVSVGELDRLFSYAQDSYMYMNNNTIVGPQDGPAVGAASFATDTVEKVAISNSTIIGGSDQYSVVASSDYNADSSVSFDFTNTYLGGNSGSNCDFDQVVSVASNNSISSDASCGFSIENTDGGLLPLQEILAGPQLGPFGGQGHLKVLPIDTESALFNSGLTEQCPDEDQLNISRPQVYACDVGAFELRADTPLTGSVWYDTNQNGTRDEGEEPVIGATMALLNSDGSALTEAVSDSNGEYSFLVAPGEWSIRASRSDIDGEDGSGQVLSFTVGGSNHSVSYDFPIVADSGTDKSTGDGKADIVNSEKSAEEQLADTGNSVLTQVLVAALIVMPALAAVFFKRKELYKYKPYL